MARKPTKPTREPAKRAASPKRPEAGTSAGAAALASTITAARKVTSLMKKRFDDLSAKMAIASRDEARGWDAYFEYMGEIMREKLWIAGGFDSARQWLESITDEPLRSLRRNVRVAESSSPDEQVKFTRSKITLALTLIDAQDQADAAKRGKPWEPSDEPPVIDWKALRYEVVRDGAKKKLSLAEITAPELQALIDKITKKPDPRDAEPTDTERALRAALDASDLGEVTIAQRDHRYTVAGARADQLEALGRALIEAARAVK
ncbi:MAG: hypothetical protein JNK05_28585 [Myxococcales bacterium]|nr:hypothetical protein [Myxococcales bacterium]